MKKKNHYCPQLKKNRPLALGVMALLAVLTFFQASNAATNYFRFYATTAASGTGPDNPATDASVGVVSISGTALHANDVVVFDGVVVGNASLASDQWGSVNLDQGGFDGLTGAILGVKAETVAGSGNSSGLFPANTSFGDPGATTNHVVIQLTATEGDTTNMNYLAEVDPGFTDTYYPISGTGLTFPNNTIALTFGANNAAEKFYDNSGFFAAAQPTPTNAAVALGQTITLKGNYEGSPAIPLAVQWFKNGTLIPGATSLTYTTPALSSGDNGDQFTYMLTNLNNRAITATSAATTISVRSTPGIVTFNFPTTTTTAGLGAVTDPGVSISGSSLLAGDTVVFDGIVVANGAQANDAWNSINIDGSGYGNYTQAQLGLLDRQGAAEPSQLVINKVQTVNPTPGGAMTSRARIELYPSANGSTTNMGWKVEIDQNLTGTFLPAVTGTNLTFPNNTLALTFGSSGASCIITQDPQSPVSIFTGPTPTFQAVAVGAPISVGVTVLGWSPAFQWRKDGAPIPNATNETYTLASASPSDNGDQFTVVVSNTLNSANVVTSTVATVAVVIPNNYTWYPRADDTTWDTVTANWTTNGGVSQTTFASGNNVTFDSLGYNLGGNVVTVTNTVNPNAVTVNAINSDTYQFTGAGSVSGETLSVNSSDRSGSLALETAASFAAATIGAGATMYVGFNGTDGTFDANNITNNGVIDSQDAGTLTISGAITGSGFIDMDGSGITILSATNSDCAIGTINSGALVIASTPAPGVITNNAALEPSSSASVLAIPNAITGTGYLWFTGFQTSIITGVSSYTGANNLQWSKVVVDNPQALGDTTYGYSTVGGADNLSSLCLSNNITWIQPLELDPRLALGEEATIPQLANWSGTNTVVSPLTFGTGQGGSEINVEATEGLLTINSVLDNSAGNNPNDLNLQGAASGIWNGALMDSTEPLNVLQRGSGVWTLAGQNTYSGTTTVSDGTLFINGLIGPGAVTVMSGATLGGIGGTITGPVTVNSGGTLSTYGGGTNILTINNSLTLGSGSFTSVEISKAAGTNDQIVGAITLAYGGTLEVSNLSGTLANGDTFQLFVASAYTGAFAAISPVIPGPGLLWTTNALGTTGTLGVVTGTSVNTTPTNITATVVSGTTLSLSWPSDHTGWTLQMNTNLSTTNWITVAGSTSTNQVSVTIQKSSPSVFYRLVYP
jgi:autotransporter-associated beta strand protein